MNLILFSVTTFAVLDYFYRFMRFVSTDLAKIAKFLCFYSKSGLKRATLLSPRNSILEKKTAALYLLP